MPLTTPRGGGSVQGLEGFLRTRHVIWPWRVGGLGAEAQRLALHVNAPATSVSG